MIYDYRKEMVKDIKDYIWMNDLRPRDMNKEDYIEYLQDELWAVDSVTGNGGDYYDTEEKCEEYVCHNLKLFFEALLEFGIGLDGLPATIYEHPSQFISIEQV